MIRIIKPIQAPKILTTRGAAQIQQDCAAYDASPTDYRSGEKTFNIDTKIYGAESVKQALRRAQYDKCCYCEDKKFLATSYGAVEHYRPKGAVQQARGQKKEYPGYYWLAYDWNNLLFSCTTCNTKKRDLFPLRDNNARARSHADDIAMEQPFLVNPAVDNPRDHIRFREGDPDHLTEIGRITIQVLCLRRPALDEARRERLAELKSLCKWVEKLKSLPDPSIQAVVREMREKLEAAIRPEAEYCSMAIDFLEDWFSK
jgi:uncharacterized protein (TIGR02646 family)